MNLGPCLRSLLSIGIVVCEREENGTGPSFNSVYTGTSRVGSSSRTSYFLDNLVVRCPHTFGWSRRSIKSIVRVRTNFSGVSRNQVGYRLESPVLRLDSQSGTSVPLHPRLNLARRSLPLEGLRPTPLSRGRYSISPLFRPCLRSLPSQLSKDYSFRSSTAYSRYSQGSRRP